MLSKKTAVSVLSALALFAALPSVSSAAGPQGFNAPAPAAQNRGPQGFETGEMTIADIRRNARDNQMVSVTGRFVRQVRKDKYEFQDQKGDRIVAELDDDYDWSHVRRDRLMRITAEVDRDWNKIELDVHRADALE